MRLLSQRDHSESELRRKLAAPPFSAKGNWGKRSGAKSSDVVESNLVESNPVESNLAESNAIEESDPQVIEQVIDYCYQHNWLDDSVLPPAILIVVAVKDMAYSVSVQN